MKPFLEILTYVLPIFYFVTVWLYAKGFFSDERIAGRLKTPFLGATLLLHLLYFAIRTNSLHHPPITSIFELMSVLAFSTAVLYFYLETRTKVRGTRCFILNLSFFFQLLSSLFIRNKADVRPVLRGNWVGFHVTSALLRHPTIAISAVYGFTLLTIAMALGALWLPRAFENYSYLDLNLVGTFL